MTETSHLHTKHTLDNSDFTSGMRESITVVDKSGRVIARYKKKVDETALAKARAAKQFKAYKAAIDPAYASAVRFERQQRLLKTAMQTGAISQNQYNVELGKLRARYEAANNQVDRMTGSVRTSRFHTANLAAQFNDIGVMMASGQSPFILAMQQGTQVSQVLNTMGSDVKGVGKALGSAFMSIVNPVSLLTIGLIAAGAALGQWIFRTDEAKTEAMSFADALEGANEKLVAYNTEASKLQFGFKTDEAVRLNEEIKAAQEEIALLEEEAAKWSGEIKQDYIDRIAAQEEIIKQAKIALNQVESTANKTEFLNEFQQKLAEGAKSWADRLIEAGQNAREAAEVARKAQLEARIPQTVRNETEAYIKEMAQLFRNAQKIRQEMERVAQKTREATVNAKIPASAQASMDEYISKMADVFNKAQALKKELGDAGFNALRLAGVDITSGISSATKEAAKLAGRLGVALNVALSIKNLQDAMSEYGPGRGSAMNEWRTRQNRGKEGDNGVSPGYSGPDLSDMFDSGGGGGGGGGATEDPRVAELEALQEHLMTQEEAELASWERRQEILKYALEQKLITQQEYNKLLERAQKEHNDAMVGLDVYRYGTTLDKAQHFIGSMADAFAQGNEKMFKASKVFAAVEATLNALRTYNQVMASPDLLWFQKIPAAIALFANAMKTVQAIKSMSSKGSGGGGRGGGGRASAAASAGEVTSGGSSGPQQQRSLTLIGDRFNRQQAIELAEFMNDGTDDGLVIRGRR